MPPASLKALTMAPISSFSSGSWYYIWLIISGRGKYIQGQFLVLLCYNCLYSRGQRTNVSFSEFLRIFTRQCRIMWQYVLVIFLVNHVFFSWNRLCINCLWFKFGYNPSYGPRSYKLVELVIQNPPNPHHAELKGHLPKFILSNTKCPAFKKLFSHFGV